MFHSFQHTAFRLEVRDRYDSPYENTSLGKFLTAEQDDLPWMQDWLTMIRNAVGRGLIFSRVRIVSLPLTDYSRFGIWCAQFTNSAGEDIRYLTRDQANSDELPHHDYWLFDLSKLIRMHFDDGDHFLGGEFIEDPAEVVKHNYWRDIAWHRARRRDDFASEQYDRRDQRS
ncbi:DUF6879 family protein [Streptomyces sp. NPDC087850]|uniref:DUF6879 family protein n=1 Tax=Streptomyces sp. NPDC087850 TaxID=3365809 RepID=UPI003821E252